MTIYANFKIDCLGQTLAVDVVLINIGFIIQYLFFGVPHLLLAEKYNKIVTEIPHVLKEE